MTAERPCCEAANDSIEAIVNASLKSGSITVGGFPDIGLPFSYNSNAVGNLDADLQVGWIPSSPGQMTGVSGDNVVVSSVQTGNTVAAAWSERDLGAGRIAVFGDVNWLAQIDSGEEQVVRNTQEFLFDGFVGEPPVVPLPAAGWLLVAGLGGLGVMKRRTSKTA